MRINLSANQRWLRIAVLCGILYGAIGIVFGLLGWRLAAWFVSAVVFAAHILFEHSRVQSSPRTLALHVSAAVALGAFVLAAAANVHELLYASSYRTSLAFALVAWPALTALPAFVAAFAATAILTRLRRNA